MGRRLCIIGFCRSIEMLSDVVEDTVLEHGGEVSIPFFFFFPFGNHFNFYPYCALNITRSPWSCALGSKTISCFLLQPQHLVLLSIERIA